MSHENTMTEVPEYFLEKEYTVKPKPEDLHEIFIIVYKMEVPNWRTETDDDTRYIFFTNLEKANCNYKKTLISSKIGIMFNLTIK